MPSATLTVSLPAKLKQELSACKEVNWSEETRRFLREKLKRLKALKRLDELLKHSELTEEDVEKMAAQLKREVWQKHARH